MKFLDGHIIDNSHFYSLRVHYEDTDIGGIVYHSKYLNFIERARSSLIRLLGFPVEKFLKSKQSIVIKNINIYWYSPCSLGDRLFVKTNLIELKKVSFCLRQVIFDEGNNKKLASADVKLCFTNENMKLIKIPENFLNVFKPILPH
tara:strand:+ start:226 stop:663 length:438 start_codon:yes stop_codon:yes gene_type:complete